MLLSLQWLREFVPFTGTAQELGDRLTMLGLELEEIKNPFENIQDMIIGHVLSCDDHPDSDHLHVCCVDIGEETADIVCGAENVAKGQLVVIAPVGATMPGGLQIKKAKLRGVPSNGMICSERELGLSDDHTGIMVLPEHDRNGKPFQIGTRFVDAMEMDTEILDISVTPNRADCLSILGIARMVAAAYDLPLTMPPNALTEHGEDCSKEIKIEVRDIDFCPNYTGRLLEKCTITQSPYFIRYRLLAVGLRPIYNAVDVTNYVLMELGQPLHAFDADALIGNTIIIQKATEGQLFTTLDDQERLLKDSDGLICDSQNAIALAGVMGGKGTEVTHKSSRIFLECALFQPAGIRRTARRLALSSDASYRFERGVDHTGMHFALERAAYLMQMYCDATIRKGICKHEPKPFTPTNISFHPSRPEHVLGIPISPEFCEKVLTSLDCVIKKDSPDLWTVSAPGRRYDLMREADLVEEIAIFYGVDTMPATLPRLSQTLNNFGQHENRHSFIMRAKHFCAGLGLNEAINYSFVGNTDLDLLNLPTADRVQIINPLTADQDVLRTSLAAGILQNVRYNIAHGSNGIRLFEIAHSFHHDISKETTVEEHLHMVMAIYGNRFDSAWGHGEDEMDYPDLRGLVDHFFQNFLHLKKPTLNKLTEHPFLSPAVELRFNNTLVGFMGRVKKNIAEEYYAKKSIWLADFSLDTLNELSQNTIPHFLPLPVYPPIRRDITFICPNAMTVEQVQNALWDAKTNSLHNIELRDIYLPKDKDERNITFRLTFQSPEKTLEDKDVDKDREKISATVIKSLNIKI